jgi:lipopolysaccharide biosynthesis glycosyltransferase
MSETVHIAFGIDTSYVPHVAATIASIASAAPGARLRFLIMHQDVGEDARRRVEACAPRAGFEWIGIDDPAMLALKGRQHVTGSATYFRLALPQLAPESVDRLIYLDSDLIVVGDIAELWRQNLNGFPVGAVSDAGIDGVVYEEGFDARPFAERWQLAPGPGRYFNAGVLLIDLAKVRAEGLFDKALAFAEKHAGTLPYSDQDALNHTLWGNWFRLDPVWNVQRNMVILGMPNCMPDALAGPRRPAIVHYTAEHKPWLPGTYHPYAWLYWRALGRTGFRREVEERYGVGRLEQLRLYARMLKHWPWLEPSSGPATGAQLEASH